MSENDQEQYELDESEAIPDEEAQKREPDVPRSSNVEPLNVEEDDLQSNASVHDLDVCPNCGAPMREPDSLVCLRCGFDLKTMKQVKTSVEKEVVTEDESEDSSEPLVQTGMGNLWLPTTVATISAAILIVSYLAGATGLFTDAALGAATGEITWSARFLGLLQFVVLTLMWTACGFSALGILAYLSGARLFTEISDIKLAALRMLAIVVAMRLATLINFANHTAEWTIEVVIQAAVFLGLSWLLFQLKPRDLPTLGGAVVVIFMVLWLGAKLVVWTTS